MAVRDSRSAVWLWITVRMRQYGRTLADQHQIIEIYSRVHYLLTLSLTYRNTRQLITGAAGGWPSPQLTYAYIIRLAPRSVA
jgi:hypothetical protein